MKKIAIIGGSYLQLPVVKKAKELGCEVHCFSWKEGAVCESYADYFYPISIIEKDAILDQCRKIGIDGITTIASDTAVVTVNYVASELGLISNPYEFSKETTDKYHMRKRLTRNGIPSPDFVKVESVEEAQTINLQFPVIVKPVDRSGSRGVKKVADINAFNDAVNIAISESFSGQAIIEEFIYGREISVECISHEGIHHILQATDKVTTGSPHFVELEHHQPAQLSDDILAKVHSIVIKGLDALHVKYGASHSELKITDDGKIYVIEIGARMGGDFIGSNLVQLSTGYDFLKGVIEIALGDFTPPIIRNCSYSGVYFLSKETEFLKSIIENSNKYPEIVDAEITSPILKQIKCSSDRSGYLIYSNRDNRIKYD